MRIKMKSKDLLKIELRNKGIQVKSNCYLPNKKVLVSFSLPDYLLKKINKLEKQYNFDQISLFKDMLNEFNFQIVRVTKVINSHEFKKYIKDNKISLNKNYKNSKLSFRYLPLNLYLTIKEIYEYYNISQSSFIRILIDNFVMKS